MRSQDLADSALPLIRKESIRNPWWCSSTGHLAIRGSRYLRKLHFTRQLHDNSEQQQESPLPVSTTSLFHAEPSER